MSGLKNNWKRSEGVSEVETARKDTMSSKPRLVGIELYFEDLPAARRFYHDTLGLELMEEQPDHHAKFEGQSAFICLERKGAESYPSQDKAVLFLEVPDLQSTIDAIGKERFVEIAPKDKDGHISWAVLHDPEGHNVLVLQAR
jgi:predicted enzyme related to lactoylglutathione lyase